MFIPQYKTITYGKHSFIYHAPYYWNKLPNLIKNAHNFNVLSPFYVNGRQHVRAAHVSSVIFLIGKVLILIM